jgi:signal transduction histidine kinase/integral membrane sensor domain MASE1
MRADPPRRTLRHSVVAALTLAIAYMIAGRLGLWLAIPPGYATVLWLPSGLALAGVLIGGARVWPGIWLGSFLANLWTAVDATTAGALLTSVAIPTSIGVGATLQALLGASLVRRTMGVPTRLDRPRQIIAVLVLSGPVSCLVSATVGVTTLAVSDQIPWALFGIHWVTWWVGDALGVLIVAPLALSWPAEPREIWRLRRTSVALPVVGALALALVVFAYMRAQERVRLQLLFERQATTLAQSFQDSLDDYLDVLYAVESFYTSTGGLSRQAFHEFIQRSLMRHPGLQALSWDLRVPDARREAYEAAVRQEGHANFHITEQNAQGLLVQATRRPEYIVVTYIEPHVGNARALGFDVASAPDQLEVLQRARDTGRPVATGRLMLVQETSGQFGLLIFLPLYDQRLPRATVEERRHGLHGYVTGVLRIGDMVEVSLPHLSREGLLLRVEDESAPASQRLLYDSRERGGSGLTRHEGPGEEPSGLRWATTVTLAGRRWTLSFAPTLEYLALRQSLQPWVVLSGGLAFISVLGAFLLIVTGRAALIEQLVAERTAQLNASKRLEAAAEQRRREAEVLAELAQTINAALEVGTVLQRVADGAKELCGSDGAAIALREPGAEAAVIRYWAGTRSQGYQGARIEPGQGIGGLVLATGRPSRTDDYARDPRLSHEYLPLIQAGRTVGVLVVPIHSGERVDGLLYVGSEQPRTFTDHDAGILQRLADHAAVALYNARLYAAAEGRRRTAESLAEVGRLLLQSLDAVEVGQRIVDHVLGLVRARAAVLYQLEPATGTLVTLAAADDRGMTAGLWGMLPPGMGVAGLAVITREPVITANLLTDPRITLPAAARADVESTPVRAVLALPLLRDGQVIGALSIADQSGRTFDEEDTELARLFADQAATALGNAQLYSEVQAGRERLQVLSRQLLEAQEAERRRIARELHDEAGQLLASVHLALEAAVAGLPPPFQARFHPVRGHLDVIETQLRRLSHDLRPTILDDLGLLPALQLLVDGVARRTGLRIRLDSTIDGRLAPAAETALYRVMQEGLTNITKHAAATRVHLQLWRDAGMIRGRLQDDGVGFAVDQVLGRRGLRGLGLLGIQERLEAVGGTLQITSAPGKGTTLDISLPVQPAGVSAGTAPVCREAPAHVDRAWRARAGVGTEGIPGPPRREIPHAS